MSTVIQPENFCTQKKLYRSKNWLAYAIKFRSLVMNRIAMFLYAYKSRVHFWLVGPGTRECTYNYILYTTVPLIKSMFY